MVLLRLWSSSLQAEVRAQLSKVSYMSLIHLTKAIQGIGAGGISSLTQIIISDLVPLHERGTYNGLISLLGPPLLVLLQLLILARATGRTGSDQGFLRYLPERWRRRDSGVGFSVSFVY